MAAPPLWDSTTKLSRNLAHRMRGRQALLRTVRFPGAGELGDRLEVHLQRPPVTVVLEQPAQHPPLERRNRHTGELSGVTDGAHVRTGWLGSGHDARPSNARQASSFLGDPMPLG